MSGKLIAILLKEPMFGCQLDEKAFFGWLEAIGGVTEVNGGLEGLMVTIDTRTFDDIALREMISLYYRYNLDFQELHPLINDSNKEWFFFSNCILGIKNNGPIVIPSGGLTETEESARVFVLDHAYRNCHFSRRDNPTTA